jgi:hypothetical protein
MFRGSYKSTLFEIICQAYEFPIKHLPMATYATTYTNDKYVKRNIGSNFMIYFVHFAAILK